MKDIKGYEGLYAITEDGKVWGYKRKQFLNPFQSRGYYQVALYKDKQKKTYFLHRLVAETYLPNPDNKPQVHHIDGNPANNILSNLSWVTQSENNNDDIHKERCSKPNRKSVYCIELDRVFNSQTEAANFIGGKPNRISDCCRGVTKTAYGYHWEFIAQ